MTYKKIAELAGVSVSTVSKVMSQSHEIGQETTERILEIAKQYGVSTPKYHRIKNNMKVAIIAPEIISIYYSKIVTAISAELEKQGITPCIYITNFDKKCESRILNSIADSDIAGVICLAHTNSGSLSSVPVVNFLHNYTGTTDTVNIDHTSAVFEAVEYLVKLGHTDIGFVGEKHTSSKLKLFRETAIGLGLSISEKNIFVSKKRFEEIGYEAVDYFSKRKKLPTALLCAYDEIAMGAVHAFKNCGIRVPQDISVMGMNDIPFASYAETPLTTVSISNKEAPVLAVDLLCKRIVAQLTKVPKHILLKGELIIRETTDKPRSIQS